jgi:23S rRNA (guanosine2251-2'-O)-methyltransferase
MEHLEGRIAVLAALEARLRRIQVVLVGASAHPAKVDDVLAAADRAGVPVKRVAADELDRMAHARTHGGVVAIASPRPPTPFADLLRALDSSLAPPFLLLLEGVEDAQTLGFTLRTAEALGAHGVLIKKHLWTYDAADVSRASSGAYERLPLVRVEHAPTAIAALRKRGVKAWGLLAGTRRTLYDADLTGPILLAIGGEKRGLSGAMRGLCDGFLSIPMPAAAAPAEPPGNQRPLDGPDDRPADARAVTSLPLGHAAVLALGEVMRQRQGAAGKGRIPALD